jgi:hypothetical protein
MKRSKIKKFNTEDRSRPVIISETDDGIKEYVCSYCSRILQTRLSEGYVWCNNCSIEFPIKDTRKRSKLETPHRNTETLVNSISSPHEKEVRIRHETELQWGAKSLSQKGTIRFTDYREG